MTSKRKTKRRPKREPQRGPRALTVAAGDPREAVGSEDPRFAGFVAEEAAALCLGEGRGEAERESRVSSVLAALKALGPRDELEGMLVAQMVVGHATAMEYLRRARLEADAQRGDALVGQAARLLRLYARQVLALGRHRARAGKGREEQRVNLVWDQSQEGENGWAEEDATAGLSKQELELREREKEALRAWEAAHPGVPFGVQPAD